MYFILSKLLYIFILPIFWVTCLVVYAFYTQNIKKRGFLILTSTVLLYFFSVPLFINLWARVWDSPPNTAKPGHYTCAIVLGGFVSQWHHGEGVLNGSKERYLVGIDFLNKHYASHILVTGGNSDLLPNKFREGDYIRGNLKERGVPDAAVLIDSKARNTFENAAYSKEILEKAGLKPPYLLLTSAFHMPRALLIFKQAGINVVPYPTDCKKEKRIFFFRNFIPKNDNLEQWNRYIKEFIGYYVTRIKNEL